MSICLRPTVNDLIPDSDTFTVTIATQGGTAIGKILYTLLYTQLTLYLVSYQDDIKIVFFLHSAGSDFMAMSVDRTFSLPLQKSEVCECLSIIQDDIAEGDEVFYVTLTSSYPQIKTTGAVIHIVDDDGKKQYLLIVMYS